MFRRRPKFVVHLALALALLIAQAGALVHAGAHDAKGAHGGTQHASVCSQCLSFSTVLSGASGIGGAVEVLFVSAAGLAAVGVARLTTSRAPHHFWSRGPPSASSS